MKIEIDSLKSNTEDKYEIAKFYPCINCNNCIVWCNLKDNLQDILHSLQSSEKLKISTNLQEISELYNLLERFKCMTNSYTQENFYNSIDLEIDIDSTEDSKNNTDKENEVYKFLINLVQELNFKSTVVKYIKH
jgi:succinate dehydrogenase/fumarate reductase-like Fe-S protein